MTPKERVLKALNLETPDRVPLVPQLQQFAARYAGITLEEHLFDAEKCADAFEVTWKGLGGWDAWVMAPRPEGFVNDLRPIPIEQPGRELPPDVMYQVHEKPIMTIEDYERILEVGYKAFLRDYFLRLHPDWDSTTLHQRAVFVRDVQKAAIAKYEAQNVPTLVGGISETPFDEISLMRSFEEFTVDLFRRPDLVERVLRLVTKDITDTALRMAKGAGGLAVWIAGLRSSCAFVSPAQFERFVWPSIQYMVEHIIDAGFYAYLHLDQDWTKNLPYLKSLPRGKCLVHFDGWTDIFKAKEVLRDHMCIMGDVGPTLLTLGSPDEVRHYCKKLIDGLAPGGGFLLGSGCELAPDAKRENVEAMFETCREYGAYA